MQSKDITAGEAYRIEFPQDEDGKSFGTSRAFVKATVIEVGVEFDSMRGYGRPQMKKGVRARLEEALRVVAGDGFRELPVGHEFEAESRLVLASWGTPPAGGARREFDDEDRLRERVLRYREQDELRAAFLRFGVTPGRRGVGGYELRGDDVIVSRSAMVRLLRRLDPAEVATKGIGCFTLAAKADLPWTGLGDVDENAVARWTDRALGIVRDGLLTTDITTELCGKPSEADEGRACTLPAGHRDPEHQATF